MTKKLLACLLTVCLIATLIPMTIFAEKEGMDLPPDDIEVTGVKKGDVNGDDVVDSDDAIYLLMYTVFGETDYPLTEGAGANFDGIGDVDSDDAIYLLMYTVFGESDYPLH